MNEDELKIFEQKSEPQIKTPQLKPIKDIVQLQTPHTPAKSYLSPLMAPIKTNRKAQEETKQSIDSQNSKIAAKKIDLFGKFKLDKMKNFGSTHVASSSNDGGLTNSDRDNNEQQNKINKNDITEQDELRWKTGRNRRLTVQLDKIDQGSNTSISVISPDKLQRNAQNEKVQADKISRISYEQQSTKKSFKENFLQQSSFRQKGQQELYSPQPRRTLLQGRGLKQMNLPAVLGNKNLLQSPVVQSRQNSLSRRQMMFQRQRPGMLDLQAIGRGSKGSMIGLGGQQLQSPLIGRQLSPKSAALIPMTPMLSIDSRAKHSKVLQKLIQESDTQKQKTKKDKYRKKNTILKNAGGFVKGNTKQRSFLGNKKNQYLESTEKQDEEDVELEVFKQFMEANQQEPSQGVFSPDAIWKSFWDLIMFIWIVWQAIYIPFKLCFDQTMGDRSDAVTILDYFMDICFGVDILLNFNTGFYKNDQALKNEQSSSTKFVNSKTSDLLRLLKIVRFLRFLKLIRVLKLSSIRQKYEDLVHNDSIDVLGGIFKLLVIILFSTHTFACIFWLIGTSTSSTADMSWVVKMGLVDQDIVTQYITSMYWAFTTLVSLGYGDISPQNTDERMVCMLSMIMFSWVYAFTLSQISKIVSQYNTAAVQFRENMFYVGKWMQQHDLRKDLSQQIRRYLEYQWDLREQQKIEEQDVMNLLNQDLREKITLYTNAKQLRNLSFCSQFTVDFIGELSFQMQTLTFGVGENVILEQEDGDRIFFITSGKVCVLHRKTHTYLDDLTEDDYFGEISFFTEQPRTSSVKSRDFTNVIYLDRASFLFTAESSMSNAMGVYYKIKNALLNNDYSYINMKCFICRGLNHIAIHCDQFKLQRGNLHKIFNKLYMKQENQQKKGSSNSLTTKFFSPSNALNTHEQIEMREVALLVDNDEKKDAQQVNTMNSQLQSSHQSQDMIRRLYQEAGYELQKDSFATELSSLNDDQQLSDSQNNDDSQNNSRNPSPLNKTRTGNLPSFYKVINLENNKSIKLSQFDNVQPGMLQKNQNYSSSSDESGSSTEENKQKEFVSPYTNNNSPQRIMTFYEEQKSKKGSPSVDMEDEHYDNFNDGELIEDFGHVETIMEVEENEEETPGNSRGLRFRNTLKHKLLGKQSSDASSSYEQSDKSLNSPLPIETIKKNSKKISSSFLKQMKQKTQLNSSKKSLFKTTPFKEGSSISIDAQGLQLQPQHKSMMQFSDHHIEETLEESQLQNQSSKYDDQQYQLSDYNLQQLQSSPIQSKQDSFQFNEELFIRTQSLDLPQLIQLQSQLLQKQSSKRSNGKDKKIPFQKKISIYSKDQLHQIQEQDDEFDPIQEESSSISNTTTIINRISSLEKKQQQFTPDSFVPLDDSPNQDKTFDGEEMDAQSKTSSQFKNGKNNRQTITDSLSFKTSQERVQYFNMLEQEIVQDLQNAFQFDNYDQNYCNDDNDLEFDNSDQQHIEIIDGIYNRQISTPIGSQNQREKFMQLGFTLDDIEFLEQMEQKNQNNDVVKKIEELIENQKQAARMKNWQIRVDSLDAHEFTAIINPSPNINKDKSEQSSPNQSPDNSYFQFHPEDNSNDISINTALENKVIKEFEKQIFGINDLSLDQTSLLIQPSYDNSGTNSMDVTYDNANQNNTFLDLQSQGQTQDQIQFNNSNSHIEKSIDEP